MTKQEGLAAKATRSLNASIAAGAALLAICGGVLAGCGGMSLPIGATGATSLRSAVEARDDRVDLSIPKRPPSTRHSANYVASGSLLYVTNGNPVYNNVTVYHAGAKNPAAIATISQGLNGPAGDCLDSDGTLYVANEPPGSGGSIVEYALGKTVPSRVITDGVNTPGFCAIDGEGNLWVTNIGGRNATEYLHGSKKPHTVITDDMVYPTGIAIDSSGNVYVSNRLSSGGDILVFPPESNAPSRTITDGVTSPVALAINANGNLYVTNVEQNNVEEYSPGLTEHSGRLESWGSVPQLGTNSRNPFSLRANSRLSPARGERARSVPNGMRDGSLLVHTTRSGPA